MNIGVEYLVCYQQDVLIHCSQSDSPHSNGAELSVSQKGPFQPTHIDIIYATDAKYDEYNDVESMLSS